MNRNFVQDYLRQHDVIKPEHYQRVINMPYDKSANEYLLQLVRSEPPEYLDGLKRALMAAKQEQLIDLLP